MAIPFLNHLDLRSVSELQNAILHKTTTTTASNVEGKFLYDTGTNTMQYYNGTAWINLDGTDTGITSITLDSGGDATSGNTITENGTLTLSFDGASSQYVNGEGNLVTFPAIPSVGNGTLTVQGTGALGGTGTFTANQSGNTTISVTHDNFTNTGTTGTATLAFGGTFDAYTGVTTNGSGHVTGHEVTTFTLPANPNTNTTYQLSVGAGTADTAVVKLDASSGTDTSLTVGVQDQALTISETTGVNGSITLGLNNSIEKTITFTEDINIEGELGMSSTIAMNSNYIQSLADPVNAQDAATKAYVDAGDQGTVTGSGTANTIPKWSTGGTGIEDSSISDNGTTVTIGGNLDVQGTTTTIDSTTVAIGDNMMKYAKDNTANASDIGWYGKIVSSGTKYPAMFYDASTGVSTPKFQLGIANTEPAGTGTINTKGTLVAHLEGNASTATALASAQNFSITGDITAAAVSFDGSGAVVLDASIDANVVGASELKVGSNGTAGQVLASDGDGTFSWANAGTDTQLATAAALIDVSAMAGNSTASFTHSLGSKNLIVQLYDTTSGQIVHADIDHTSNNAISITFALTGTELVAEGIGDIRVVVIDAKNGLTDKTVSYS